MKPKHIASALLMVLASVCGASIACAHTRSVSYSRWEIAGQEARVELRIAALELTRFASGAPPPSYFATNLSLSAAGERCAPGVVERVRSAPNEWAVFRWTIRCARSGPRAIESLLLADVAASHVHFARVAGDDDALREKFLIESDPVWVLDDENEDPKASTTLMRYVALGVNHIALGWDHLAFLCALLLLARSLREVTLLVSAFTLAHSVTLVLAVTGVVRPQPAAVETVIGFSIALVAAENAWLLGGRDRVIAAACVVVPIAAAALAAAGVGNLPWLAWAGLAAFSACHFALLRVAANPAGLRAGVAFAFGLVHGLGFAGVLMEMDLPVARLAPALVGFNVGVEIGQLVVVAIATPLLALLAERRHRWHRAVTEFGSAAIFAVGVFWVVVRGWG